MEPQKWVLLLSTLPAPHPVNQWSPSGAISPRGHLAIFGEVSDCHNLAGGEAAAGVQGWRPGILLSTLHYTRQPPLQTELSNLKCH